MQQIKSIIRSPYEPQDITSLWIDTADLDNIVVRVHENGSWKATGVDVKEFKNVEDRMTATEPYIAWLDPYIWDDVLVWPSGNSGGGGGDVDVYKLLNSAPTLTVRGSIKDGDKRYLVYHPLMDYEGAEIVLMRYAKHNKKKEYDEDEGDYVRVRPKKGFCVAAGSHPAQYFTFSAETSYDDLYDYLNSYIQTVSRHFGIALRIPNPEWDRSATVLKNGIYKGVPESLWSDVLPINIGYDEENNNYGIGLI